MKSLIIDNKNVTVEDNTTILDAAKSIGIDIPTLCYLKGINEIGACRICVVEVKGNKNLVIACKTIVKDGMEVITESERVIESRKNTLNLLLSTHNKECIECSKNNCCELQDLFEKYRIVKPKYEQIIDEREDTTTSYIVRDNSKCILCGKCAAVCKNIQSVGVIGKNSRGIDTHIGCAFEKGLRDVPCVACGQCILACPTGALSERDDRDIVKNALNNKELHVIVGVAPSVRFTLGESFNMNIGTNVKGKMVTALRKIGFSKVFDVNFAADLTIMEEGNEFIERLNNKGPLPLITSCSPGWIKYMESFYPELIDNVSSCKSPQQMFGATIKTYYALKNNIDPRNIFVVTIMPCVAKKFECKRNYQDACGLKDVDAVLTTRELAKMIDDYDIEFNELEDNEFDNPFGVGASVIFGATGGVMESALRTVKEILENKESDNIEFDNVRGTNGIKEATYKISGKDIKVAVISGIKNAKEVLEKVKNKEVNYDFIEIMTCPGGCINGGGQPIVHSSIRNNIDIVKERTKSIYTEDRNLKYRKAHENPDIIKLYDDYFIKPGSKISHEILHTKYSKRKRYNDE